MEGVKRYWADIAGSTDQATAQLTGAKQYAPIFQRGTEQNSSETLKASISLGLSPFWPKALQNYSTCNKECWAKMDLAPTPLPLSFPYNSWFHDSTWWKIMTFFSIWKLWSQWFKPTMWLATLKHSKEMWFKIKHRLCFNYLWGLQVIKCDITNMCNVTFKTRKILHNILTVIMKNI